MNTARDHISVCICTYKRPELLDRLLNELQNQITNQFFTYSIVVVDNDYTQSANSIVASFKENSLIKIDYYCESEQNISLARNKAIKNAKGNFIVFIDDDEYPVNNWLVKLYKTCKKLNVDGVLGPVKPYFEKEPPRWVLKGRFFDRPTHPTGYVLGWNNTRTGNVILRRELVNEDPKWFDPEFGSGGEDREFFRRKIAAGHVFVWCNEAPVFETVPPKRWERTVLLKRALLRGKMAFNSTGSRPKSILKSTVAIAVYTGCLPLFFFLGHHVFMKYLIKNCDHLGKVLAFFGIDLVKEKYVSGN